MHDTERGKGTRKRIYIYIPTALKGAVIINKDVLRISYKQKREKCGDLSGSTTIMTTQSTVNSKTSSSFSCSKCGNKQQIEIQSGLS